MGTPNSYRLLILDPVSERAQALLLRLQEVGVYAICVTKPSSAHELINEGSPDVVLVRGPLPEETSTEFCTQLRTYSTIPLIVLSQRETTQDRIESLNAGADDCVNASIETEELIARVQSIVRRARGLTLNPSKNGKPGENPNILIVGNVRLDLMTCRVTLGNVTRSLTPNEFRLMAVFMGAPDEVFTREDLRKRVWPDDQHSLHLVEVHIANLRSKIEPNPHRPTYIVTVRSLGYKFHAG